MGAISSIFGGGSSGGSQYNDTAEDAARSDQLQQVQQKQKSLQDSAKQYRDNLGQTQQQMGNMSEESGRRDLAAKMGQIDSASNSRGLLYSGIKQGAQSDASANYANTLANQRAQINQSTNDTANQMDNAGISAGFQTQQLGQQQADEDYQRELNRRNFYQGRSEAIGGLLGKAGGTALGS